MRARSTLYLIMPGPSDERPICRLQRKGRPEILAKIPKSIIPECPKLCPKLPCRRVSASTPGFESGRGAFRQAEFKAKDREGRRAYHEIENGQRRRVQHQIHAREIPASWLAFAQNSRDVLEQNPRACHSTVPRPIEKASQAQDHTTVLAKARPVMGLGCAQSADAVSCVRSLYLKL